MESNTFSSGVLILDERVCALLVESREPIRLCLDHGADGRIAL